MPRTEAEGMLFIEESVSDAMSDTTLDCKLSKADVSGHIGTGGRIARVAHESHHQILTCHQSASLAELPSSMTNRRLLDVRRTRYYTP
jgi:hypothetical protein